MAKKVLGISLLILTFMCSSKFAANYYVDAVGGNDSYNGTSPATAWKTLTKVNSKTYLPGDNILFKSGQTFYGTLDPKGSGTSTQRIYFGSYGTAGVKPIISKMTTIPGSTVSGNWQQSSSNIWYMNLDGGNGRPSNSYFFKGDRIWINNQEYAAAYASNVINSTDRVYMNSDRLYIYSTNNPSSSVIEYLGHDKGSGCALRLNGTDYLTIDGIKFQGGYNCVNGKGADYVNIKNSVVRRYRNNGINATSSSLSSSDVSTDYWIVEHDTIDFDYRVYNRDNSEARYNYYEFNSGIQICNNASYWEVRYNYFNDNQLDAVMIFGINNGTPQNANFNKIHHNFVTRTNSAMARAFTVYAASSTCGTDNEIYNNYVTNMTLPSQIAGNRSKVYYNIFDKTVTSTVLSSDPGTGRDFYSSVKSTYAVNPNATGGGTVNGTVYFYNNTMYSSDRAGIWINKNAPCIMKNNLILNCGNTVELGKSLYLLSLYQKTFTNNCYYNSGYTSKSCFALVQYPDSSGAKAIPMSKWLTLGDLYDGSPRSNQQLIVKNEISPLISIDKLINASGSHQSTYFAPAAGSPLINAGVDVGLKEDFFGNPIVGNPDIGAIESGSSTTISQIAPVITSTALTSLQLGQNYSYDVNANGSPTPTYSLKAFPQGMTINSSTGLINWTATSAGSYNVTVEANNGVIPAAQQSFTITVVSPQTSTIIPSGVISYWGLNETSGNSYSDKLAKNNAVGVVAPQPIAGKVGGAQFFNGSTTKIDAPVNPSFNFGNQSNFSVEFWYKGSIIPTTVKSVVGRNIKETSARWYVGLNPNDGKAKFYMYAGGTGVVVNGTGIVDGNWHHVVATRNGINSTMKIYVDGSLKGTTTANFAAGFTSSTANLNIGWLNFQDVYALNGNLDEVAIYNSELSSAEILQHYKNGSAGLEYFTVNYLSTTKGTLTKDNGLTDNNSSIPSQFGLNQNYPNPFNPVTRIRYAVSEATNVTIKVYDMLGAEVMTLVNGSQTPGYYEVSFNGSNLASGMYIYQLRTNNFVETKKMMLMK